MYWDSIAPVYDKLYTSPWSQFENEYVQQSLTWLANLDKPKILDLGCGTGLGYELCRSVNPGVRYVGIDISSKMLAQFKNKHPEARLHQMDIETFDASEFGEFDAVVSFFTSLSYIQSLEDVLPSLRHSIKPGGYLRISVLHKGSLRRLMLLKTGSYERYGTRGGHSQAAGLVRTYSPKQLNHMARAAGFVPVERHAFSVFAQTWENPKLWKLDRTICKVAPSLAHTTDLLVRRK